MGYAYLRSSKYDRFSKILKHEGECRSSERHGVCAMKDNKGIKARVIILQKTTSESPSKSTGGEQKSIGWNKYLDVSSQPCIVIIRHVGWIQERLILKNAIHNPFAVLLTPVGTMGSHGSALRDGCIIEEGALMKEIPTAWPEVAQWHHRRSEQHRWGRERWAVCGVPAPGSLAQENKLQKRQISMSHESISVYSCPPSAWTLTS